MGWLRRRRAEGGTIPPRTDHPNIGVDTLLSPLPEGMGEPVSRDERLTRLAYRRDENEARTPNMAEAQARFEKAVGDKTLTALMVPRVPTWDEARAEADGHFADVGASRVRLVDVGLSESDLWLRVAKADGFQMIRVPLSRADLADTPSAAERARRAVEESEAKVCECTRPDARDALLDRCAALVRDAYTSVYPSTSYPEAAQALSYAEQCILAEKRRD